MSELPNLAGVATAELVEKIGGAGFQASYINWSRTLQMMRTHAPGWLPELVRTAEGGILHRAPAGAYLLIRFRHLDGTVTPEVPQAIMDTRNAAIPLERITARDITDTHRRGVCMAAAFTFGLAYELWAKMPLETGFAEAANEQPKQAPVMLAEKTKPTGDAWERLSAEERTFLQGIADKVAEYLAGEDGSDLALEYLKKQKLDSDETIALWTRLDSKQRATLKKAAAAQAKDNQQQEQAA